MNVDRPRIFSSAMTACDNATSSASRWWNEPLNIHELSAFRRDVLLSPMAAQFANRLNQLQELLGASRIDHASFRTNCHALTDE
ncbi:MAG TPA: hypothetical protein VFS42_00935, partial [Burkholderiaceae bacterium]|nr:hypothetical protein [Burkholderiaceae bacterium]